MRNKPCFNGYTGINRSHKTLYIIETLREVSPSYITTLFKVNNRNTRKRCEICSKLTIKTPKQRH